jgi:hypothetical protein
MRARRVLASDRNRLRKVSPQSMVGERAALAADGAAEQVLAETGYVRGMMAVPRLEGAGEMLALLDWYGIERPRNVAEAGHAKRQLLAQLEQQAGAPGDASLRAAGFTLLSWWIDQGNPVTATLETDTAKDSYTVDFLGAQLRLIDEGLDEDAARQSAYTIAQAWRAQATPHWTTLDRSSGPKAMTLRKPGGIRQIAS